MIDNLIAQTPRLHIRHFTLSDALFIVRQLNDPGFLRFIGDRGVRDVADAERYLRDGPMASYAQNGHGLNAVLRSQDNVCIGMCGVLKRDSLPAPDLGYAFLPEYRGQGYAEEATRATLTHAREVLKMPLMLAIVQADNPSSIRLLQALGFGFESEDSELQRFRLELGVQG
jgi:[ribosomal protein S5]-alanine N-acetyltransferase